MKYDTFKILEALLELAFCTLTAYALMTALDLVDGLESDAAALAKLPTITQGGGR